MSSGEPKCTSPTPSTAGSRQPARSLPLTAAAAKQSLPVEFGRRPGDRRRYADTLALLGMVDRYLGVHKHLPAAERWSGVALRFGRWARRRGLRVTARTLRVYRARCNPESPRFDYNRDGRGAPGVAKPRGCSAAAWACFCEHVSDKRTPSLAAAWRRVDREARRRRWGWYSSPRSVQARAKAELPCRTIKVASFARRRRRYPVELTQVLPGVGSADDGASKPMLLFGDLEQACRVFRSKSGMELRTSEHVKFAEGQLAMVLDVWQDRVVADENAIGRLITHS